MYRDKFFSGFHIKKVIIYLCLNPISPACGAYFYPISIGFLSYFYCISTVFLSLPDNFRQTLGQIYRFVYIINN
jgi:hypothetical protein